MIDPNHVTDYTRDDAGLEEWWLFCSVVAGKTAHTQTVLLDRWLKGLEGDSPFDKIRCLIAKGALLDALKTSRLGQFNRLSRCFEQGITLNLRTATVQDFEGVYGWGPKTARFFILHSREGQRLSALDTHILKFLRDQGIETPLSTPSSPKTYAKLEADFLRYADASGKTPADFDLWIWRTYSGNL